MGEGFAKITPIQVKNRYSRIVEYTKPSSVAEGPNARGANCYHRRSAYEAMTRCTGPSRHKPPLKFELRAVRDAAGTVAQGSSS